MFVEDYEHKGVAVYFEVVVFEFGGVGDGVDDHREGARVSDPKS